MADSLSGNSDETWVHRHQDELRPWAGQWMAVQQGEVAAIGESFDAVYSSVLESGVGAEEVVFTFVREPAEEED